MEATAERASRGVFVRIVRIFFHHFRGPIFEYFAEAGWYPQCRRDFSGR